MSDIENLDVMIGNFQGNYQIRNANVSDAGLTYGLEDNKQRRIWLEKTLGHF